MKKSSESTWIEITSWQRRGRKVGETSVFVYLGIMGFDKQRDIYIYTGTMLSN